MFSVFLFIIFQGPWPQHHTHHDTRHYPTRRHRSCLAICKTEMSPRQASSTACPSQTKKKPQGCWRAKRLLRDGPTQRSHEARSGITCPSQRVGESVGHANALSEEPGCDHVDKSSDARVLYRPDFASASMSAAAHSCRGRS